MSSQYSQEFKNNAVEKLLGPNPQSIYKLSVILGVAPSTLYGWKRACVNKSPMKKNNKIYTWTREEQLNTLIKTSAMSEQELGIYLRENGLHSDDLKLLRDEILNSPKALKTSSASPEVTKLRSDMAKKEKEIEGHLKSINRKNETIAEMSARILLLKKSHEIWGPPEEEK